MGPKAGGGRVPELSLGWILPMGKVRGTMGLLIRLWWVLFQGSLGDRDLHVR